MSGFIDFCHVAEAVAATSKRLEKARLSSQYLSALDDDDLRRAVTFLSGRVFPQRDQRTVHIGGSSLFGTLETISGVDPATIRQHMVRLGDLGDLAFVLYCMVPHLEAQQPSLSLQDVAHMFDYLASVSGNKPRLDTLRRWLGPRAPLEAKYLVKLMAGDLRIGLKEGALEDCIARSTGATVAQVQWTNMLLGDVGETAVLARHEQLGTARMRLFHPLKFMLATPAADNDDVARQLHGEFVVEDKYDGIRAQIHVGPATATSGHGRTVGPTHVAIFSRTLDDITLSFPELVDALAGWAPGDLILDGEIVPVQNGIIRPFAELQTRLGRKVLSADMLAKTPVAYVAYDLLYGGDEIRLEEPLQQRRQRLEALSFPAPTLQRAPSRGMTGVEGLDAEFAAARARGNEGLMVKDPQSTYKPGRRGRDWLKIKRAIATLDVVVTAVEVGSGRRARFLSDYTFAVRESDSSDTLLNVGKAYSGLTDAEIADLSVWFTEHTLQTFGHGRMRLVEPGVVLEITFDGVQVSKRHKSGFALRFPRIVSIRRDKPVSDIDTVDRVRSLVQPSAPLTDSSSDPTE